MDSRKKKRKYNEITDTEKIQYIERTTERRDAKKVLKKQKNSFSHHEYKSRSRYIELYNTRWDDHVHASFLPNFTPATTPSATVSDYLAIPTTL